MSVSVTRAPLRGRARPTCRPAAYPPSGALAAYAPPQARRAGERPDAVRGAFFPSSYRGRPRPERRAPPSPPPRRLLGAVSVCVGAGARGAQRPLSQRRASPSRSGVGVAGRKSLDGPPARPARTRAHRRCATCSPRPTRASWAARRRPARGGAWGARAAGKVRGAQRDPGSRSAFGALAAWHTSQGFVLGPIDIDGRPCGHIDPSKRSNTIICSGAQPRRQNIVRRLGSC